MNQLKVLRLFETRMKRRLRVLMYHRFSMEKHPHRVSAAEFERQLKYLKRYARVISIDEAIDGLTGKIHLPDFSTVITIDDGYRDSYEIAFPILRKLGLPATMYAVSSFMEGRAWLWTDKARYVTEHTSADSVETSVGSRLFSIPLSDPGSRLDAASMLNEALKQMSNDDKEIALEKLADDLGVHLPETPPAEYSGFNAAEAAEMGTNGITIGSHTISHPLMNRITAREQESEAKESRRRLAELTGLEISHFCYPNGSFDDGARLAVRNAGYRSAVSSDFGYCRREDDLDLLPRIPAEDDMLAFLQNYTGLEGVKRSTRRLLRGGSA